MKKINIMKTWKSIIKDMLVLQTIFLFIDFALYLNHSNNCNYIAIDDNYYMSFIFRLKMFH